MKLKDLSKNPFKGGFISAAFTLVYVAAIALVFILLDRMTAVPPEFLGIIFVLSLLVLSAAVCGTLVFGIPVLLFIDKEYKKGLSFLGYTLVWFAIFVIIILVLGMLF